MGVLRGQLGVVVGELLGRVEGRLLDSLLLADYYRLASLTVWSVDVLCPRSVGFGDAKELVLVAWVEKHGCGFRVRYRLPDGSVPSEPGFLSYRDANNRARDVESEQRTGAFVDPRLAQTVVGDWVRRWSEAHDVSEGTWAKYDAHLRNHILPRFGEMALGEVNRLAVKGWIKSLRRSLADTTVVDVVTLLSIVFNEAVDEGLIGSNPCRRLRVRTGDQEERPHATAEEVSLIAVRGSSLANSVMMIMAAYCGMRWGELAGLQWCRIDLDRGLVMIEAKDGALHEVNGKLWLGPPKTKASVRTVHLPRFVVELLRLLRAADPLGRFVFTAPEGGWHRRANFRRRIWLPAVAGDPKRGWESINPVLHFHDLRHTQKTWLIEDRNPEVVQCRHLGHKLHGVPGIYSHITQAMIDDMPDGPQCRWERCGSRIWADHYRNGSVVKIGCSQNAPRTQIRPVGDDHRQAV